jgi:hypothetical protein
MTKKEFEIDSGNRDPVLNEANNDSSVIYF